MYMHTQKPDFVIGAIEWDLLNTYFGVFNIRRMGLLENLHYLPIISHITIISQYTTIVDA